MEAGIAKGDVGGRAKKVHERHDHFAAAKVAEDDVNTERGRDPRPGQAKEG